MSNGIYFNGPPFLHDDIIKWPEQKFNLDTNMNKSFMEYKGVNIISNCLVLNEVNNEIRKIKIGNIINIEKYSSLKKLILITSYVMRFINNLLSRVKIGVNVTSGVIKLDESVKSEKLWIMNEQDSFITPEKYKQLQKSFNLYDEDGIFRLKGRYSAASLNEYEKNPILISNNSYFTKLVVLQAHYDVLHAGLNCTLNQVRSKFWICRGRQVVKSIINKCVICKLVQAKPLLGPVTPDLAVYRLANDFAFTNTGLDFAGPLYVRNIFGNDEQMHKCYILLFTCATSWSVHLELSPGMDVENLIKCLKRFIARRGTAKLFISDNFSTFKSQDERLVNSLRYNRIDWKFILPLSPWWGGFYERLIRIVKSSMRKVIGKARLNFEELYTVLCEIELMINSRPLTYLNETDISEALTPSHLVIGKRLQTKVPEFQLQDEFDLTHEQCTPRVRYLQVLIGQYWNRFHRDYLNELREKQLYNKKKTDVNRTLKINDMVIIKDDDQQPRNRWRKGVIHELIVGQDDKVRGAILRVCDKNSRVHLLKRPIQRLITLELLREEKLIENECCVIQPDSSVEVQEDNEIAMVRKRPFRAAAATGELIRRLEAENYYL